MRELLDTLARKRHVFPPLYSDSPLCAKVVVDELSDTAHGILHRFLLLPAPSVHHVGTIKKMLADESETSRYYAELFARGLIEPCGRLVTANGTLSQQKPQDFAMVKRGMKVCRNDQHWGHGDADGRWPGLPGSVTAVDRGLCAVQWLMGGGGGGEQAKGGGASGSGGGRSSGAAAADRLFRLGLVAGEDVFDLREFGSFRIPQRVHAALRLALGSLHQAGVKSFDAHNILLRRIWTTKEREKQWWAPAPSMGGGMTTQNRRNQETSSTTALSKEELKSLETSVGEWELNAFCNGKWKAEVMHRLIKDKGAGPGRPAAAGAMQPGGIDIGRILAQLDLVKNKAGISGDFLSRLSEKGFDFLFSARTNQLWKIVLALVEHIVDVEVRTSSSVSGGGGGARAAQQQRRVQAEVELYSFLLQLSRTSVGQLLLLEVDEVRTKELRDSVEKRRKGLDQASKAQARRALEELPHAPTICYKDLSPSQSKLVSALSAFGLLYRFSLPVIKEGDRVRLRYSIGACSLREGQEAVDEVVVEDESDQSDDRFTWIVERVESPDNTLKLMTRVFVHFTETTVVTGVNRRKSGIHTLRLDAKAADAILLRPSWKMQEEVLVHSSAWAGAKEGTSASEPGIMVETVGEAGEQAWYRGFKVAEFTPVAGGVGAGNGAGGPRTIRVEGKRPTTLKERTDVIGGGKPQTLKPLQGEECSVDELAQVRSIYEGKNLPFEERASSVVAFYPTAFCVALFCERAGRAVTRGDFAHSDVARKRAQALYSSAGAQQMLLQNAAPPANGIKMSNFSPPLHATIPLWKQHAEAVREQNVRAATFRGAIVEKNFAVRICTDDDLQLSLFESFCVIQRRSGWWALGKLTQDSVLEGLRRGLTAKHILDFLTCTAHAARLDICHRMNTTVVPDNVRVQIELWERDRSRLRITPAVMLRWVGGEETSSSRGSLAYSNWQSQLPPEEVLFQVPFEEAREGRLPTIITTEVGYQRASGSVQGQSHGGR